MGFLSDLRKAFQKRTLRFVRSERETGDIVSFFFDHPGPGDWSAGQHGILFLPGKMEGGSFRGFSLSSAPGEEHVRVTTRVGSQPSAFKKALSSLKPGDEVVMRGPVGPFRLEGWRGPVVFAAGGVGVTPYRAMLRHLAGRPQDNPPSIQLLHAARGGEYPFRAELEALAQENKALRVSWLTGEELAPALLAQAKAQGNAALYFLSGSPALVQSLQKALRAQGIRRRNIRRERFRGLKT